ncbi:hypothetical protein ACD661_16415 [Legionella lytica]|uniref:Uncharacterized protein n=1 Tax=Legionella lytica TaxID=96232 RepID=A0ABW8DBR6_9GAMM
MLYWSIFFATALSFVFLSKQLRKKNKETVKKRMQRETLKYEFTINGKPALVYRVTSEEGERYAELNSALEDIKFAKSCFSIAINALGSNITYVQDKEEIPSNMIINDSLCKAAIVSYARAFNCSEAGRSQIGIDSLNHYERAIHKELMHIRNTFIAHAGYADTDKSYEFVGTYILRDPDNIIAPEICALNRRANGYPKEKLQEYLNLIEKIILIYQTKLTKSKKIIYRLEIKGKK